MAGSSIGVRNALLCGIRAVLSPKVTRLGWRRVCARSDSPLCRSKIHDIAAFFLAAVLWIRVCIVVANFLARSIGAEGARQTIIPELTGFSHLHGSCSDAGHASGHPVGGNHVAPFPGLTSFLFEDIARRRQLGSEADPYMVFRADFGKFTVRTDIGALGRILARGAADGSTGDQTLESGSTRVGGLPITGLVHSEASRWHAFRRTVGQIARGPFFTRGVHTGPACADCSVLARTARPSATVSTAALSVAIRDTGRDAREGARAHFAFGAVPTGPPTTVVSARLSIAFGNAGVAAHHAFDAGESLLAGAADPAAPVVPAHFSSAVRSASSDAGALLADGAFFVARPAGSPAPVVSAGLSFAIGHACVAAHHAFDAIQPLLARPAGPATSVVAADFAIAIRRAHSTDAFLAAFSIRTFPTGSSASVVTAAEAFAGGNTRTAISFLTRFSFRALPAGAAASVVSARESFACWHALFFAGSCLSANFAFPALPAGPAASVIAACGAVAGGHTFGDA